MPTTRLVLASASPSRLRLLRDAGIDPEVVVSGVDEEGMEGAGADAMVAVLARRKAEAVAARVGPGPVVVGADSTLELDGVVYGKPGSPEEAVERWAGQRGRSGVLVTGHHVVVAGTGAAASGVVRTVVHFGCPTDEEIAAYVATGEPLGVAGAFTLEGYGAAFVAGVEGDPSNVIGLSIPLLRRLLGRLGFAWTALWR